MFEATGALICVSGGVLAELGRIMEENPELCTRAESCMGLARTRAAEKARAARRKTTAA